MAALIKCGVREVEGCGRGVVADAELSFGDVVCIAPALVAGAETVEETLVAIMRGQLSGAPDAPRLLRLCWTFCGDLEEADGPAGDEFAALLRSIPAEEARRTLAERGLADGRDVQRLGVKLSRNGFAEGVFPDACRFNHSCRPNCLFFTRPAPSCPGGVELVIVATERVDAGAELTISYLPEARTHLPTDQRRMLLERQYDFRCTCRRCHRPAQPPAVRRAERALEAMCCAKCAAARPAHGLAAGGEGADVPLGAHLPLDEHEDLSGERAGGYTPCARCGAEADEAALDSALLACHAHMGAAARAGAGGSVQGARAEHDALCELLRGGGRSLFPTHWLAIEIRWRLQATSAALLARAAPAAGPERRDLLRAHAAHSLALVEASEPIVGASSHLMAALCARCADALDSVAAAGTHAEEVDTAAGCSDEEVASIAWGDAPALRARAAQLRAAASPVLSMVQEP